LILTTLDREEFTRPVNADAVKKYFAWKEKNNLLSWKAERVAQAKISVSVDWKPERAIQAKTIRDIK
jgi:hypothetical protein